MEENKINITELEIQFTKDGEQLTEVIERLGTKIKSLDNLRLLNRNSPYLLDVDITEQEDSFTLNYSFGDLKGFSDYLEENYCQRLRAARNLCLLEELPNNELTPILHPETVFFDDNSLPKISIRYIEGMRSNDKEVDAFIRQVKALVLLLLNPKLKWETIYKTVGKVVKDKDQQVLVDAQSIVEIKTTLEEWYKKEQARINKEMSLVSKKTFRRFQITTIVSSILAGLLVIPLGYYLLFEIPIKNKIINGSTYFLSNNYGSVVDTYASVPIKSIPLSSKYQLAFSYVQLSSLNNSQKALIQSNLSVKSVEEYLDYWIYFGRNQFEEAHEAAKTLQDIELKYYAVIGYLDFLHNRSDLKGSAKETKIQEYTNLKANYEKELQDMTPGEEIDE